MSVPAGEFLTWFPLCDRIRKHEDAYGFAGRQNKSGEVRVLENILESLPGALLPWFDKNKRCLPWRQDRQPYHIWVSEIMLQQTRVEAVKGYYTGFLQALTTLAALAECDDEQLLKLWEGLGYYSRARNLKKAAQQIQQIHGGVFPADFDEIRKLSGIGDYTAGAISSIAFGQKRAAVDGNVLRVYARLMADDTPIDRPELKKKVRAELEAIYPERAGDFTQALMELGATVCGPNRLPDCDQCPCKGFCQGRKLGNAAKLPVKTPKKQRRIEEKTVFILRCEEEYALIKRPDTGLLAGMWQFPEAEGILEVSQAIEKLGIGVQEVCRQLDKRHIFTHIEWQMRGFYLKIREKNENFQWFSAQKVAQEAALPTAYRQFWDAREDF
jgi:A/G-specific adenine glycosylase